MRQILVAAAALAVGGFLAATTVRAEPVYEPGGPAQIGGYCQKVTDASGFGLSGYYEPCAVQPVHITRHHKKMK